MRWDPDAFTLWCSRTVFFFYSSAVDPPPPGLLCWPERVDITACSVPVSASERLVTTTRLS